MAAPFGRPRTPPREVCPAPSGVRGDYETALRPGNFAICCLLALAAVAGAAAPTASAAVPAARLLPDGRAVAPPSAPPSVKAMIEAANRIRHRPYKWGGGHRSWNSRGYDCSGSVSYVLHAGGLLESPLDSTGFMRWGRGGAGSWVRIYANREHVFAIDRRAALGHLDDHRRRPHRPRLERRDALHGGLPAPPPGRVGASRTARLASLEPSPT